MVLLQKVKNIHSDIIFILIFIIFAGFYYDSILDKGPLNTHIWRQTDCLSITRNYAEGASFFQPEMDVQFADSNTSGKTAGEFPILYYIVGNIWKIFGVSNLSYRLFYLFILLGGIFAFYKSLQLILKDAFWANAISFLLFTSPVLVVFGVSFLTDGPAFSFVLIALFFLVKYKLYNKALFFYISMLLFTLAGLVKISSLIAFVFLLFIFLIENVFSIKTLGKTKLFNFGKHEWFAIGLAFLSVFSWYFYASYYNGLHGFKYTFNDIYPIWIIKDIDVEPLISGLKNYTSIVFFSRPVLYTLLFIGIFNLLLKNKLPLFSYLASIIIVIGGIIYFVLWAPLLGVHDYYFVAFLIVFIGVLTPFIWFIKMEHYAIFKNIRVKIIFGVFLVFNFLYCLSVVKLKTLAQEGNFIMVGNHSFVKELKWVNWDVSTNWNRFERMKPYIRELGIQKDDKIISLPDHSFNTSLYLVNQKGWTNFLNYNKKEDIENLIDKGAKYLFVSKPETLNNDFLKPFLTNKIGNFEGIEIFKLPNKNN